jgi:GMP synthase-like glutamine amidotransferase
VCLPGKQGVEWATTFKGLTNAMPKLAILQPDILYDALRPVYDGYGRMVADLLHATGLDWQLDVFEVINGEYPEDQDAYQAFLITGSKYDSFADDDWVVHLREYVQMLYAQAKPMVGICFGHQLLAHSLGGRAGRSDAGWGLGVMEFRVCEKPPFVDSVDSVNLLVSHQDQVHKLPEGARLLLSNDFCPNAGYYIPGRVLAIQGHAEFTVPYLRDLIAYRGDMLPVDVRQHALETMNIPHQGQQVGRWIKRFLESI